MGVNANAAKLQMLCNGINNASDSYMRNIANDIKTLVETFNNNWCSNESQKLAGQIKAELELFANKLYETMADQNEAIKVSIENISKREGTPISYPGFSWAKAQIPLEVNATLPNGHVGVSDDADLTTINSVVDTLRGHISSALDAAQSAAQRSDALDRDEMEALKSSILGITTDFNTRMNDIRTAISTRMSAEIAERDKLKSVNLQNLQRH